MREDIKYGNEATVCHIGEKLGMQMSRDENLAHYRARLLDFMDRQKGGGPAFGEFHKAGDCEVKNGGMTLRDYFAAKAMAACLANPEAQRELAGKTPGQGMMIIAKASYMQADAMLAERAK